MRISTAVVIGGVLVAVGLGAYELGHGVDSTAHGVATVATAIPAQAAIATAEANLAPAVSAATSYQVEHGSYTGLTTAGLRSYDAGLAGEVSVRSAGDASYCIESAADGATVNIRGPNGSYAVGPC